MDNKQILGALSMDLKRVALGIHRESYGVADRFLAEALKRKSEINVSELPPYMQGVLEKIGNLADVSPDQRAEDALMFSTRVQNYVLYK